MSRKEKWIAKKRKGIDTNSTLGKFQELMDWDESYRIRNRFTRRLWWENTFRWFLDAKFYIELRIIMWKRKRKNKK